MSKKARNHLIETYSNLAPYIELLPTLSLNAQESVHSLNAISEVVIGQMLSRGAARSIKNRAYELKDAKDYEFIAQLTHDELRSAGLSSGKAKTIKLIFDDYKTNPKRVNDWSVLPYDLLKKDVSSFWGVSDWTASILALFYFGNSDVFPFKDGSIVRVMKVLNDKGITFSVEDSKPYRSYLALYLWAMLDNKLLE
jgi:DNA-3-methyladenine glycosylase II